MDHFQLVSPLLEVRPRLEEERPLLLEEVLDQQIDLQNHMGLEEKEVGAQALRAHISIHPDL